MTLRFEAWTFPWLGAFQRKVADLPVIPGSASSVVSYSDTHEVTLSLPSFYDRLSEVVSPTAGSLIRVLDGDTIIQEMIADRYPKDIDRRQPTVLTGGDIASVFGRVVTYFRDYPKSKSLDPNWIWGGDNMIDESGFEGGNNFIPDSGFESATLNGWEGNPNDGSTVLLSINSTDQDTGTYCLEAVITATNAGPQRSITGLVPGKTYTITARVRAPNTVTCHAAFTGPDGLGQGTADALVDNNGVLEARKNFTGTGAYQTVTFNFVASNEAAAASDGSARGGTFILRLVGGTGTMFVDQVTISGMGGGCSSGVEWFYSNRTAVTVWESSTDFAHTGTHSCKVTATNGAGVYAKKRGVKRGRTYTASAWLRNASGAAKWAVRVTDPGTSTKVHNETTIAQQVITTSTTWQQALFTFTIPDDYAYDEVRLWIRNVSGGVATVYFDDAELAEGFPADYPGVFINALMDDAAADHAADPRGTPLNWIDYSSITATTDSNGTPWPEKHSFVAYRGMTLLQAWDRLVDLEYEWELVPKATPIGVLTHDLRFYVPQGLGSLLDAADDPTITVGQSVQTGAMMDRMPTFGRVLVEGADNEWTETEDAAVIANFGPWERYVGDTGLVGSTARQRAADNLFAKDAANASPLEVTVLASPAHPRPLVDYRPGDRLYAQFPPGLQKALKRVETIAWTNTVPASYTITGSRVFKGEAAAYQALKRIHRRFTPLPVADQPLPVAPDAEELIGGGTIPWLVAATDSPAAWKTAAAYQCSGVADHLTIQQAIDDLSDFSPFPDGGGVILLAPGYYLIDEVASDYSIDLPSNMTLEGAGGYNFTVLATTDNFTTGLGVVKLGAIGTIRNISILTGTGTKGIVIPSTSDGATIDHCYVNTDGAHCIHNQGADNLTVTHSYTFEAGDAVANIRLDSTSHQSRITHTRMFGGLVGVDAVACDQLLIDHCFFEFIAEEGVRYVSTTTGGWGIIIESNTFNGCADANTTDAAAIRMVGPTGGDPITPPGTERHGPQILGNYIFNSGGTTQGHAIRIVDFEAPIIAGNQIHDVVAHGIQLVDVNQGQVYGNIIAFCGTGADVTWDGIHLDSDSNLNNIHGNTVIDRLSGNRARYGLRINSADCDDNIVVGNDLRNSGGTANYSDAGTGTINTYPGGAIGDNFG